MGYRHGLFMAVSLCAMMSLLSAVALGQEGEPQLGPDGKPIPQFDPNKPPKEPVPPQKPVPPAKLEPDMGWLETRKSLLAMCDGIIDLQFAKPNSYKQRTDNPMVQQFREYLSAKYIVSEWHKLRPLDIDWSYPVPVATEAIAEIEARLEKQLTREAEQKFPLREHADYVREAERKYRVYKIREMVEVPLLHGGRGVMRKRRGRLLGVGNGQIKLAPRMFISRHDMSEETAARFFRDVHAKVVKDYAEKAVTNCQLYRSNYVRYQIRKQLPTKLKESHYVPNHIDFLDSVTTKIFKPEQWCSREELVLKQQKLLWEKNIGPDTIGDRMRNEFMRRQGFRLLTKEDSLRLGRSLREDEVNRHEGWVPNKDVIAMEAWLVKEAKYKRDLEEYGNLLQQYNEDMIKYKQDKKEFDRKLKEFKDAGGVVNEPDEDGE